MADFKGMSILMNMRDVGIDRTLKQIKGQFKTLGSEMKRSTADFQHSEKSMQTFNQRTKELNKAIGVTENSMKDISNQLKKMTMEEQRTSAEAEKLRQEYSKQNKALNMYKRQLTSTENEMKNFNTSNKRAVFSMEKINSVLGTMRKQLNIANTSFQNSSKSVKSYENYLKQLNVVISKHQNTIKVLEGRYKQVVKEQGEMSHEAINLKQKIQQEKQSLAELNSQYKQTSAEAKRFSFEQKSATQSMSQIRQKISQVSQSLQISASKFKMSGQTAQAYKARILELNNGMKQQQLIVQNLSRQYDYAKKQYGSTSAEAQKLNAKLVEERVKLKDLSGQLKQTTEAHNRLQMEQQQGISSMSQIRQKMSSFNDTLSLSRSNLTRAGESVRAYKQHLDTLNTNMSQQRTVLRELTTQYNFMARSQGKNSAEARELSSAITQQKIRMNELETEIQQTSNSYKQLSIQQKNAQALSATGFGRAMQTVNKYDDSIRNVGMSMRSVGTSSLIYMTMPAVAAMSGAIKSSVEWEQALAGVAKTTDMTGKELQGMGSEITAMSNKMPFAATEIAGVAEAAGQLGVKKSEITDFTETMMNMSVATNLTADEAATEFARFANAAGMPIEDVDRLGAAVVNLGNTTATTEAEIVEMGQRLAGAGAQAGFSADEIMSISAAMSSVGINAEAGGTAMTQIFNKITKATADGGATLDNFAKVAGMSAEQFSSTWEDNPTKALAAFVKGLGDTEGGAKGVLRALEDVGIKGIREADTIRRMSNNHKILDEALKTGAEGWKENTALTDEAAIRYETMGSKLSILRNTFVNFLRTVGDAVAPAVIKLSDILTGLFEKLQHTSKGTRIAIAVFAGLAAIIPPLLISGGLLLVLLSNMAKSMIFLGSLSKCGGILAGLKVAFSSLLGPIGQVVTKIPLIGPVLGALSGPIGWITLALVGIGTALVVAYKKSETFRNIVNGALSAVITGFKALWSGVMSVITPIGQAIAQFGGEIASTFSKFWQQDGPMLTQAFRNILAVAAPIFRSLGTVVKTVFNGIRTVITTVLSTLWPIISPIILALRSQFTIAFGFIKNTVVNVFNLIKGVISGVLNVVLGIVKIFGGLLTGNWSAVWQGILMIVKGILNVILSVGRFVLNQFLNVVKFVMASVRNAFTNGITIAKNIVIGALKIMLAIAKGILNGLLAFVKFIWTSIKTATSVLWNAIKFAVLTPVRALYQGSIKLFNNLRSGTINIFNAVKNFALKVWTLIKNRVIANAKLLWAGVKATFNLLKKGVSAIFNSVKNFVIKLWTNIKNRVVNLAKTLWNNVRNTFNSLRKGVSSIFNTVKNLAIKIWSNIKSRVTNFARGLWNGVRNTFSSLRKGVSNIFNNVKNNAINTWNSIKSKLTGIATNIWNAVKNTFNTMKNGLKGIIEDIKGHITDMVDAVKSGLNGLIKGLNWVGGKLGLPKIPKLSTGTQVINRQIKTTSDGSLKQGTMAVVGDKGPGNGKGKDGRREMIRYPNGRTVLTPAKDTTTYLPKGSSVINGATTQNMLSTGTLPHFSLGSLAKDAWNGTKSGAKWLGKKASGGYKKAKEAVTGGAKWLGSKVKDVMDYVDNPGKLLDLALKAFGVDFSQFKNNNIVGEMTQAGWKKIKSAAIQWIKGGMDAQVGDGSVFDGYRILQPYSAPPKKPNPNYPFNGGVHHGVDYDMKVGTPVKTPMDGKVRKWYDPYGGGNAITVSKGKTSLWFMHLAEQLRKTGESVKAGQLVGKSGNTGSMTNYRHLHFQVNEGGESNNNSVDPIPWLKKNGKGGAGANKPASKWIPEIKRAAKQMKVKLSGAELNGIVAQIQRESNGNSGVTQGNIGDINNILGTPAQGLLQYVPSTFKAYAMKGHNNIKSGYDQLLAFFNNSNWRKNLAYGKSGWGPSGTRRFATGGLIKSAGWYNIAEAGYPEWVIPTDPNRQSDAMKLLALAAQDIDSKNKRNKRPNQMRTPSTGGNNSNDNTELLLQMIANQQKQLDTLMQIARSNKNIEKQPKGFTERDVSKAQGKRAQMMAYSMGGDL